MTSRRRALAALGVAAVLAGCGGSSSEPPPDPTAAAEVEAAPCVANDALYGAPAEGFAYMPLDEENRLAAIRSINLDENQFGAADARLAERTEGEGQNALLLAVPLDDPANALEDFAGGAAAAGNPVRREDVAGHDVRWADYGSSGSIAVSLKGCHLVWVVAADLPTAQRLARAVFA